MPRLAPRLSAFLCVLVLATSPGCAGRYKQDAEGPTYAARSRHPGGVNTTFCDGSVKFIKDTININIWRALSTTQGGEVISSDAF